MDGRDMVLLLCYIRFGADMLEEGEYVYVLWNTL